MRKLNIAPRILALQQRAKALTATGRLIYEAGYWYSTVIPCARGQQDEIDKVWEALEWLTETARRLPGAAQPNHERQVAALRVELTRLERRVAELETRYEAAYHAVMAMQRPSETAREHVDGYFHVLTDQGVRLHTGRSFVE